MHTIHIRDINDDLYDKLKQSSRYSNRSMAKEALVLIRDALDANANELMKRRRILHDMDAYRNQIKLDVL